MHKHTPRDVLEELVSSSQVVISATGVPGLIGPGMVRPGAWVVDVGTTPTERGLVGDVDPQCASVAHGLSPVPGGVGPLTVALLMANLVLLASKRRNGRPVELESVRQEA
jgi:methylenetetrahydrofolate dehydrogenase (NADP+)/methenyltetrahydrofolate cyclohydrolase